MAEKGWWGHSGMAGVIGAILLLVSVGCAGPAVRETAPAPGAPAAPAKAPATSQREVVPSPRIAERPPAAAPAPPVQKPAPVKRIPLRFGYTIQAGAFSRVELAARLTGQLQEKGLPATYFVAKRGLYKVRFGNYRSREEARAQAEAFRSAGVISEFYIVRPDQYALAKLDARGEAYLRDEIVRTARSYLGIPYLWGGSTPEEGFDCSGLTMAVYQLNGLELPRSSTEQYALGEPVAQAALAKGDLIFFGEGGGKVSHVGIYAGGGLFIHAPGRGKRITTDSLAKGWFSRAFLGGRSYVTRDAP